MIPYKFFHMNSISFGKYLKYSRACSFCAYFSNGFSLWCPYKETRFGLRNDIAKKWLFKFFFKSLTIGMYEYTVLFQIKFFQFFNLHKTEPPRKEQRLYTIFSYRYVHNTTHSTAVFISPKQQRRQFALAPVHPYSIVKNICFVNYILVWTSTQLEIKIYLSYV